MPRASAPAPEWPWPFDAVDYRLPDGTYVRLERGDPIPTTAVDEPASTLEES